MAELVTANNLGVLPPAVVSGLTPYIDSGRPFLDSTREYDAPIAGVGLTVPLIVVRPAAHKQEVEKGVLTSTETHITPATFDLTTIGGYGDISIQLLLRSDPSFLVAYLALMAEAYGETADAHAIEALLDEPDVEDGGTFDPSNFTIGPAVIGSQNAAHRLPDRLWLSTAGVQAFVDARTPQGAPVYPNGIEAPISSLRPVYVPALDDTGTDALVGPSGSFGWAHDGTYTLQAMRPAQGGQEIALVGFVWLMPTNPAAFTSYSLES